ncbi:hypothetical protein RSC2_00984 [Bacillus paralicheniformis]|nr:hypothetical protein RSC2_00984 [Bacillus paralicheniformis]
MATEYDLVILGGAQAAMWLPSELRSWG